MMLASLICLVVLCSKGTTGMSEVDGVYEEKAAHALRFLDLNNDGHVSRIEYQAIAELICSLSDAECDSTRKQWTEWIPEGEDSIQHDDYIEKGAQVVDAFPDLIYQGNLVFYGDVFDKLDSDKDGVGSPEEIRRYYAVFGYGDDYDIDAIFRTIDVDDDDQISRDEFATAGAVYWSNKPGYENFYNP